MALRDIIIYGHPTLRIKTSDLEQVDENIKKLANDMIETMIAAEGIGLAAPQINESISLLVVNNTLIDENEEPKAYINPVIKESNGTSTMEEGCLSIPDVREDVERPETIVLKYLDINGVEHEEQFNGMLARVLQHEIDHLNGVLFVDRISPMKRKLLSKRLKRIAAGN